MAKNNFNNLLRHSMCEIHTKGKNISSIGGYGLSADAKEILLDLYKLIMETTYIKQDTRSFLVNKYVTYRTRVYSSGCAVNKNTSRSRIFYDTSKLKRALGEDFFDVIIKNRNTDLSRYKFKIQELLIKYKNKSLLDGFAIKLPQCNQIITNISDDDVDKLSNFVQYGSKKAKEMFEKGMTEDFVGYLMYLEQNKEKLEGKDLMRYNKYIQWLV